MKRDILKSIYCYPENYNLEVVYEYDFSLGSHDFDLRIVWRHKTTGLQYTARDWGCSCPIPFEKYTSIHDLEKLPEYFSNYKSLDSPKDYKLSREYNK